MKWFESMLNMQTQSESIYSESHVEHVNTKEKMQEFADKLIPKSRTRCVNYRPTPSYGSHEHFERDWENALFLP